MFPLGTPMADALRRKVSEGFYDPKAPQLRRLQGLLGRSRVEVVFRCDDGAPLLEVPSMEFVIWTDLREKDFFWKYRNERAHQVPVAQVEEAARQIVEHLARLPAPGLKGAASAEGASS
ncbi:hypothetical protein ABZ470_17725 [Streptosporangium sp. NPDC020072]|uniref:hypothetical protein n=1 Tax=Streptosporangium sp. NPDC020072 TaxID=3154788 RepID=UPI00342340E2